MAGSISEHTTSRAWHRDQDELPGIELILSIVDTDDYLEVITLIDSFVPATFGGLVLQGTSAEPLGGNVWKGYARYLGLEDDSEYTFDTGGGTQHITQSLATINVYAPPGITAPDFQGAIGCNNDRVEGVDIVVPNFQFTETHSFTDAAVDTAYRMTVFTLTGCFNNASFKGLAAGECMLIGVSGAKRGNQKWSLTFRFAGSANVTGQTIGDITGIDKLGWDHLWVAYADFEDSFAYRLVSRPIAVYVERVSHPGDFSLLNIGI